MKWVAFPTILFGSAYLAWVAVSTGLNESLVVFSTIGAVSLLILVLQRVFPAIPEWRHWKRDAWVDLLHTTLSSGGASSLVKAGFFGALYAAAAGLADLLGSRVWPTSLHLVPQIALALVIADLPAYWWHRLSHSWEPLWRFHAMHHSSERLYMLSSGRSHPMHVAVTYFAQLAPLILLGAPHEVLVVVSVFTPVHGFLQHANINLDTRLFNLVFATCDLHRWHHSTVRSEEHTNFGNNLIVWDWVFGTRFLPEERPYPEAVGLADMPGFPRGFIGQLASPFTWRRLRRRL